MRTKALLYVSLIIHIAALNVVEAHNLIASEVENPMLKEGKTWVYDYHHFEENEEEPPTETVYPVRYTIIGDTIIDNKPYYKMYQEIDNQKTYYAAYREEGLKVFVRYPHIDEDIIVADFEYEGLYDPNGYEENDPYSAIKEYIDYIEVDGIQYRRHTYYENDKDNKLVIGVEGIGYTEYGLMYPSIYGPQPDCVCDFKVFSSCEMNGKCIFTIEDFYKSDNTSADVDVDNDGILTAKDLTAIVDVITGKTTDEATKSAADVNGDGVVNIADIVKIANTIRGSQEHNREYVPFVEEGKIWYCGYWHPHDIFPPTPEDPDGNGIDCIFTMHGDTLIGDKEYKKVYCQFEEYYGDKEQHYYCTVREEAYQVFIIEEKTTEEKLIYDFSRPGELITITYNDYKFARTKGGRRHNFLSGQLEYRVCRYSGDEVDYSNDPGCWIDGVGVPYNNPFAFEFSHLLFDEPKLGKEIYVLTCMKDGKYIYMMDWMAEPNEPTSIDDRNYADNSQKGSILYDLQGRRLSATPQKGVYIQNGKKKLVK